MSALWKGWAVVESGYTHPQVFGVNKADAIERFDDGQAQSETFGNRYHRKDDIGCVRVELREVLK